MKNLSLVLNIVLLVAVAALYVIYFSGSRPASATKTSDTTSIGDLKVAYVNSDSLLKYYDYLKVNREQLESKTQKMDQDYRNRAQGLQEEFNAYQRNVSNMTLSQVRAAEEDLGKKQQNLQMYQQRLTQELMQEEQKLNQDLYERVTAYLKKYGEERGLHLVLKYDAGSDVLYGGAPLDITKEVIEGLNADYSTEKGTTGDKAQTPPSK